MCEEREMQTDHIPAVQPGVGGGGRGGGAEGGLL